MKRRKLLAGFGTIAALTLQHAAVWAQTGRAYRLGVLETIPADQNAANLAALRRGLEEHGYVEGRNLTIEYRSAEGHAERFPDLAAELVRLKVDLIVTRGTPAAKAAKTATETIPIVMAAIGEPRGVGVVASLARPGGNVTGLSAFVTELAGKRVELVKWALPSVARIGFMQNMGNPMSPPQWEATTAAAKTLGLSAELFDVRSESDIAEAFAGLGQRKIDALSVGIDALTQAKATMVVDLAAAHRVVTAYPSREFVDGGGLMCYGPSYPDLYYRAAGIINKVLNGTRPGDLPVEQPTKLELVINLKTARVLGLSFPSEILTRADEVLE